MTKVFIHGPSLSPFGKFNGSHLSLSYQTVKDSVTEFGSHKLEFLIYASFSPDRYTKDFHLPAKLVQALGLKHPYAIRMETASSSGASALQLGVNLIQSGRYKHGLVVATEIMSQLNREENNLLLGSVLSDSQRNLGMSMAQGGAMITNRYLELYGYKQEDLFAISKKLHDNGLKNPIAQIKKNLSPEDYEKQPMITSPLGLYDISPLSDGSASVILSVDKSGISIKGMGHGTAPFQAGGDPSFDASVHAFASAYKEAGIGPEEIQIAELHDAFTPFEIIGAEDAGLFGRGEALAKVISKITHPEGQLPINSSGGLKSRGHPVGASGLAQIVELCRSFKQREELRLGLAHSIGGLATNNFATVLEHGK
ncbi:thiolase family protein [Leptospira ilyithenensis]|uniref:Thiolase family protein n=1 Tax=Leptospira ilyithenensis TaxID=2484901 RepID=A0A4R9LNR5_9LEPT|nr:thiolase family protein [Leptospira ilyithenensis]TGN08377.1 thiolase family protein [Leptospira ilyithenensis]